MEDVENKELIKGNLKAAAPRYLTVYLGTPTIEDWNWHIDKLADLNKNKQNDLVEFLRRAVSFAILYPKYNWVAKDLVPEDVLLKGQYWGQFRDRDWFEELKKIAQEDLEIMHSRNAILSLGIVKPLAWQIYTRQAFNWLVSLAEEKGDLKKDADKVKERLENLVYIYGGNVICSTYEKMIKEDQKKALLNMRTGYFFEKMIYKYYNVDQLKKIKTNELSKTDKKLVKSVRV